MLLPGDRERLSTLIRRRREMMGGPGVSVVSSYEAGRDGWFWSCALSRAFADPRLKELY